MIVIGPLEDLISDLRMAEPLESRYKMGNNRICRGLCHRNLVSKCSIYHKNEMDMIWHDNVFIHMDTGNMIPIYQMAMNDLSCPRQGNMRGVEGAAPYNAPKDTFSFFGTNGDEIRAGRAVVKVL